MIPSKLDLTVWRGTSFELELVSQIKNYVFDPDIHNGAADLKRTHAENLEEYGFTYEYVNFLTLYPKATLTVLKPWRQNNSEVRDAILTLDIIGSEIELTARSVKVGMDPADTQKLTFDSGEYTLMLETLAGKIDGLIYGTFTVKGEK